MKSILPVAFILAALLAIWYVAAVFMNLSLQRDLFANNGREDVAFAELAAADLNMDRPKLPAPHQIVAELNRSVFATSPTSKRGLVYHGLVTLQETLLGFVIGAALGIGL